MRHTPEAGAVCGNSARTDLCGGAGGDLRPYRNHHPKETDLLFPRVLARDATLTETLERLNHDHQKSQQAVHELQHQLLNWEFLGETEELAFVNTFELYKQAYLEHMRIEDTVILPAARKLLSDVDWNAIDSFFSENQDPLTGQYPAKGIFKELFSRIARERHQLPLGGQLLKLKI